MRNRILVVTRNLPPLRGGMERLNLHLVEALSHEGRVTVVGPAGCAVALAGHATCHEIPVKPLWRFLWGAWWRAILLSLRERPDVVFAGSGLCAPIAWIAALVGRSRSVVYLHGLDIVAPNLVYQYGWLPFIRRMDLCITNSAPTLALARAAGVDMHRLKVIHPGVDQAVPVKQHEIASFLREHGLQGKRILLSVGRLTPRKGLFEYVSKALRQTIELYPDAVLVVIGDEAPDALAGSAAGAVATIFAESSRLGLEENICFLGACDDLTLRVAYASASACIFPVINKPGDIEGFGMVAIEAASYGVPTVAFAVGGVVDAVRDGLSGSLVDSGDYARFAAKVNEALSVSDVANGAASCIDFAKGFYWSRFGDKLHDALAHIIAARHK